MMVPCLIKKLIVKFYCADSKVVLGYLSNKTGRFHIFMLTEYNKSRTVQISLSGDMLFLNKTQLLWLLEVFCKRGDEQPHVV